MWTGTSVASLLSSFSPSVERPLLFLEFSADFSSAKKVPSNAVESACCHAVYCEGCVRTLAGQKCLHCDAWFLADRARPNMALRVRVIFSTAGTKPMCAFPFQ